MRLILLSILTLVICSSPGRAQTAFPNGDFEAWDTLDYEDLHSNFWITGNRVFATETGVSPMVKVTGFQSAQAIRLEVKTDGNDTLFPFLANELEGFFEEEGGKPYNDGQPTAFKGFCRHNLLNTDTAHFYLVFKKNGIVLSRDTVKFYGSKTSFTEFTLPLNMSDSPDTIIAFSIIGDPFEEKPATPGSWLELDSLNFTIGGLPRLLPDANFEHWDRHDYDVPEDWEIWSDSYPGLVVRSRDKNSGVYAMQLATIVDSFFMDTLMGHVAIRFPIGPVSVDGGLDSLKFYYKYTGTGGDMGSMVLQYYNAGGMPVGTPHILFLNPASGYVQVTHNLTDRPAGTAMLNIMIQSSSVMSEPIPGSTLHIDDMRIDKFLSVNDKAIVKYSVYPNPAHDVLNITAQEVLDYNIKDMTGRALMTGNTESGKISISAIPIGNYMLTLTDKNGNSQNMKFSKQ